MNYGNAFHRIPTTAVKGGCFFSILPFTDRNLLLLQMEAGKKIKQIFIMSWPLGDRELADYLVLQQKDSVQKIKDIITNNRSFTTAKIKVDAGRVLKSVAFQCCDQGA